MEMVKSVKKRSKSECSRMFKNEDQKIENDLGAVCFHQDGASHRDTRTWRRRGIYTLQPHSMTQAPRVSGGIAARTCGTEHMRQFVMLRLFSWNVASQRSRVHKFVKGRAVAPGGCKPCAART